MNIAKRILEGNFDPAELRWCLTSSKTGQQKVAEGQQGLAAANSKLQFAKGNDLTDTAQGTLSQFEGPVQNSPFYKSLLTTGTEATTNAYDSAKANANARANAAGFGYTQPIAQGAQNQVGAQEASALAAVPREAMTATAPLSLQAAQDTAQIGENAGSQALGWNQASQNWNNDAYNMQSRRNGWLQNLNNVQNTFGPGIQAALAQI
jgi:hypothetical protein